MGDIDDKYMVNNATKIDNYKYLLVTIGSTRSFDLSNAEFSRRNHDQGKFNTCN